MQTLRERNHSMPSTHGGEVFHVQLVNCDRTVTLTRREWRRLLEVTDEPRRQDYLRTPEYLSLPDNVRLVVKDWVRHSTGS